MFFKNQFIKNYLKIQVVGQAPGLLEIQISNLSKLDKEYQGLEDEVKELIQLLPGIEDLQTDFNTGRIKIYFDQNKLMARRVLGWINYIIDVAIAHFDFIKNNWEQSPELVKETLANKLKQSIR